MSLLKTRSEIAAEWGISYKTFKRWIDKHQIVLPKGRICPKNQKILREKLLLETDNKDVL